MSQMRPVVLVSGTLVAFLGVAMLIPLLTDVFFSSGANRENWTAFAGAGILSAFCGGGAALASWGRIESITNRQGFLVTVASWVALTAFGAVPFSLGVYELSYTDAFFEAMSAITTTGATVIVGLDDAPRGLLLWRSMLQWFGGVGVIITAFAILPALKVGGMQIFRSEAWDTSEKFLGSAAQFSLSLTLVYILLTAICFMFLFAGGMGSFDALNHALTTLATGGMSTRDASVGAFLADSSLPLDIIIATFMVFASLPFGLYVVALLRGEAGRIFNDSQVRFFIGLIVMTTLVMLVYVYARFNVDAFTAFRLAYFNIVSVLTGSGFVTADYSSWGGFATAVFFCLMFIGGCSGSTSCGMKIFRLQVILAALRLYSQRLAHPRGVFIAKYNGRPLSSEVFVSVLSFFFVYFAGFATIAVALSVLGHEPLEAISASAAAVTNVGPGLGPIVGPLGNFANFGNPEKWLLAFGMLLGRLEFLTVIVVLTPAFWRD